MAENQFVAYSGDLTALIANIVAPDPRIAVVSGSASYTGANSATSLFFDLRQGDVTLPYGVLLTSGDGTPPTSNTQSGYGESLGKPGDADLTGIVTTVFPQNPETFDATVLQFQLNVLDASVNTILFDVLFGSDEFPEYVDSYVDIGAVIVNGSNVAFFNNDPQKPLSVLGGNLEAGAFRDNTNNTLPIEYDGISAKLTISAPVHLGLNTIKIAVADTGDSILDSGLFISNLRSSEFSGSGLKIRIDAGADIDLPNLLVTAGGNLEEHFVGGGGNDTISAGGGDDLIDAGTGNDEVQAGDGDDETLGGAGNDILNGGAGIDAAVFSGLLSASTVGAAGGSVSGSDGSDTLTDIERLQFANAGLAFDLDRGEAAGNTVRLIGAAFGTQFLTPEINGIVVDLFDGGFTMPQVSAAAITVLGSPGNEDFVRIIFRNVVDQEASQEVVDVLAGYLVGNGGALTQAQMLEIVANLELNETHIGLVGMQQNGVEFV